MLVGHYMTSATNQLQNLVQERAAILNANQKSSMEDSMEDSFLDWLFYSKRLALLQSREATIRALFNSEYFASQTAVRESLRIYKDIAATFDLDAEEADCYTQEMLLEATLYRNYIELKHAISNHVPDSNLAAFTVLHCLPAQEEEDQNEPMQSF